MKKKLFSLLTALVLCLLCAVPAFAEMPLVMDTYELFKPEATAELEQKAQDASAGHGVNVYLLTVPDIGGQNVREFAKDWYRSYDLGYGEGKSGILFLIALDSRDYVTITYGGGVTAFTDYRIAQIEDKIVPMLSDGSYYKASDTYIEMCADTLDFYAEKGAPLDSGNDPAKGWIKWVFVFVTCTNGARCVSEIDCPPYWLEATCAMIWVAMLHAVEKLCGRSMSVPVMTVPFSSMSSRFTRSQLCMCCA